MTVLVVLVLVQYSDVLSFILFCTFFKLDKSLIKTIEENVNKVWRALHLGVRQATMATVETLHTRLDKLQWEVNQLEMDDRWLREENPEQSRVLMLEAELEWSKNETAELSDRDSECEQQIKANKTERSSHNSWKQNGRQKSSCVKA